MHSMLVSDFTCGGDAGIFAIFDQIFASETSCYISNLPNTGVLIVRDQWTEKRKTAWRSGAPQD